MLRSISLLSGIFILASCNVADIFSTKKTIEIACKLSRVILQESEAEKMKKAFGEGSFASAVCEIFAPTGGSASDQQPTKSQTVTITLSNGETVTGIVKPADQ